MRPQCCPPYASQHAAGLRGEHAEKPLSKRKKSIQTAYGERKGTENRLEFICRCFSRGAFTFIQVQFLILLLVLLLLPIALVLQAVFRGHPLDLPGRFLPLAGLVGLGLGGVLDEVVRLGLGESRGALALEKELQAGGRTDGQTPA